MKGAGAAFVLLACAATAGTLQVAPLRDADSALRAYAAGDDRAVERWIAALPPGLDPVGELHTVRPTAAWSRATAAFLLEVAAADPTSPRALLALQWGRDMVLSRPTAFGDMRTDA